MSMVVNDVVVRFGTGLVVFRSRFLHLFKFGLVVLERAISRGRAVVVKTPARFFFFVICVLRQKEQEGLFKYVNELIKWGIGINHIALIVEIRYYRNQLKALLVA